MSGMGFVGGRFEEVGIWFGESEMRGKDILGKKKECVRKLSSPEGTNIHSQFVKPLVSWILSSLQFWFLWLLLSLRGRQYD